MAIAAINNRAPALASKGPRLERDTIIVGPLQFFSMPALSVATSWRIISI